MDDSAESETIAPRIVEVGDVDVGVRCENRLEPGEQTVCV